MKVTYTWLKEFVDIPWEAAELAERLTLSGSEVESFGPVPSIFENIVVGKVLSVDKHPNADRLTVCMVNLGNDEEQIICGAPNVAEGQLVPVALPGATLPNGLTIKAAKIRGVESKGMICSESELGLSEDAEGIMVLNGKHEVGASFIPDGFEDDTVFDIFINPNRPDCMSVVGIAREISALANIPMIEKPLELRKLKKLNDNNLEVIIKDKEKCPRYCAGFIKNIKVQPSPLKMQHRLNAVGIRPINNIVDITNYCLVEWGQPMHAFDLREISENKIVVQTAKKNDTFVTLDDIERKLNDEVLMICDASRQIAIGGIMGGANSEIREDTTDIVFESAYFNPNNILRSAQYLGLQTEASRRFERGMDPNFSLTALKRACQLLESMIPDLEISDRFVDTYPEIIKPGEVTLRKSRVETIVGIGFDDKEIVTTFENLGVKVNNSDDIMTATVPTYRHDLYREIDLIEEIPRVLGLDRVPPKLSAHVSLRNVRNPKNHALSVLKNAMTCLGFTEVVNYSMYDARFEDVFKDEGQAIALRNPISPELSIMRQSLLPGLLEVAEHNINRGVKDFRAFEMGKVFSENRKEKGETIEKNYLSGIIVGRSLLPSWDHREFEGDFFNLKGILEAFFTKISLDKIELISYDAVYADNSFSPKVNGDLIGSFGEYKNKSLFFEFDEQVFVFEFDTRKLVESVLHEKKLKEFSKFPPVKRELAIVIPDELTVQAVLDHVKQEAGPLLTNVEVQDVYRGKQLKENAKSVRVLLTFHSLERSLLDEEIAPIFAHIIDSLRNTLRIDIRL